MDGNIIPQIENVNRFVGKKIGIYKLYFVFNTGCTTVQAWMTECSED